MKAILFILGCSLIALGMKYIPSELSTNANGAKSAIPHIVYWMLLPLEKYLGRYAIPFIGLIMVIASILLKKRKTEPEEKEKISSK
ncbi:hypothetical protein [Acidovorax sp. NCPPB 4044]|uniref:hypothetical protein n=1 Tax=Acidovorax sp. NCPPB 4044 TaxID=2940490 RepID=UPI0023034B2F|nr:hypothetical protein [Acidovorax sp. NCPPB 4044]MDA8521654.1 hypothetical protein [Acidovorax sp. NCPPB 4044]